MNNINNISIIVTSKDLLYEKVELDIDYLPTTHSIRLTGPQITKYVYFCTPVKHEPVNSLKELKDIASGILYSYVYKSQYPILEQVLLMKLLKYRY